MRSIKKIWAGWMIVAAAIGGFISTIIMLVFYYTLFLIFAIPFRVFGKSLLARQGTNSNWINRTSTPSTLNELQEEF